MSAQLTAGEVQEPARQVQRLTIMLRSRDHAHHHALATELLDRARHAHLAGATLLQAADGQGRSGRTHRHHLFREDAARSIVIVEEAGKLADFLAALDGILRDVLVVLDDVTSLRA